MLREDKRIKQQFYLVVRDSSKCINIIPNDEDYIENIFITY